MTTRKYPGPGLSPIRVACPTCRAPAGSPCVTETGLIAKAPHYTRRTEAMRGPGGTLDLSREAKVARAVAVLSHLASLPDDELQVVVDSLTPEQRATLHRLLKGS